VTPQPGNPPSARKVARGQVRRADPGHGFHGIPTVPASYTPRARLDRFWDEAEGKRLVLVVAGAGFGKTTFLAERARRSARPALWMSLSELDVDPAVLLARFGAALDSLVPAPRSGPRSRVVAPALRSVSSSQAIVPASHSGSSSQAIASALAGAQWSAAPSEGALLSRLVRACGDTRRILFFDDVQTVADSPEALRLLDRIAHALPEGSTVVLASREPVGIHTARLRSMGAVAMLGRPDLQFSEDELTLLLRRRFPAEDPDPALVRRLLHETEGWAAGLEIFLQVSGGSPWAIRETLERSSEAGAAWFSYFAEEVLERLDEDGQRFLLCSSLLPCMTGDVCDRALGITDSSARLEALAARDLFTYPTEGGSRAFRYHHLFRQFLLDRLERQTDPEALRRLRLRCARVLVETGAWAEAAMAYAEGGDPEATLEMVGRLGEKLLATGKYRVLRRAMENVPGDLLRGNVDALAVLGRIQEIHGEWDEARQTYRRALARAPDGSKRAAILCQLAQARIRCGEYRAGEKACVEALRQPGRKSAHLRGRVLCLLGVSAGELGRLTDAEERFRDAIRVFRRNRLEAEEGRALCLLAANVCYFRGDYQTAKDLGRQALVIFQRLGDQRWVCHTMMGIALHAASAGEEREARDLAERALRLAESLEYRMALGYCHHALGRCALLRRNPEGAREHFQAALRLGEQLGELSLQVWPRIGQAEADLLAGNRRAAASEARAALAASRGRSPHTTARCHALMGLAEAASRRDAAILWWKKAERVYRRIDARCGLHEVILCRLAALGFTRRQESVVLAELLAGVASMGHRFLLIDAHPDRAAQVCARAVLLDIEPGFAAGVLVALGQPVVGIIETSMKGAGEGARGRFIEILARIGGNRARAILQVQARSSLPGTAAARGAVADLSASPLVPLHARGLGPWRLSVGDQLLPPEAWKSGRALKLLHFLLVQRSRWVPKEVILEAIWPGSAPSKAENNLRQTIHLLRRALEPPGADPRSFRYVRFRNDACQLDLGEGGSFDADVFQRRVHEGNALLDRSRPGEAEAMLRSAIDLYGGDLLEEYPYEEFLESAREDLRDRYLRALEKLIAICSRGSRWDDVIPLCRRGLARDPYSDPFAWNLIHALLRRGDRTEALKVYRRFEESLTAEFDLLPSARLRELAERALRS